MKRIKHILLASWLIGASLSTIGAGHINPKKGGYSGIAPTEKESVKRPNKAVLGFLYHLYEAKQVLTIIPLYPFSNTDYYQLYTQAIANGGNVYVPAVGRNPLIPFFNTDLLQVYWALIADSVGAHPVNADSGILIAPYLTRATATHGLTSASGFKWVGGNLYVQPNHFIEDSTNASSIHVAYNVLAFIAPDIQLNGGTNSIQISAGNPNQLNFSTALLTGNRNYFIANNNDTSVGTFGTQKLFNKNIAAGSTWFGHLITLAGNFTITGANNVTFNTTAPTTLSLPASGTVATGTGTSGQLAQWNGTNSITNSNVLPNGVTATSQPIGDSTQQVATDSWVQANMSDWWLPVYRGLGSPLIAETFPLVEMTGGGGMGSQNLFLDVIYIPTTRKINNLEWFQTTQGAYTASNYNGVGICTYNPANGTITLVDSSANDGNIWKGASNTYQTKALVSTYTATPGVYVLYFMYSSSAQTTAPALGLRTTAVSASVMTDDFTNSAMIVGSQINQTVLPQTRTMSNFTAVASIRWFGLK